MLLSSAATHSIEEVAATNAPRWFQLYWVNDREICASFVRRAEDGRLRRDRRHARHADPRLAAPRPAPGLPAVHQGRGLRAVLLRPGLPLAARQDARRRTCSPPPRRCSRPSRTSGSRGTTSTGCAGRRSCRCSSRACSPPTTPSCALAHGIDGMIVSNHGGRQVDGAVAALDALVEIRDALPDAVVLMDGGIRCAADVLKAVALGADAVLLGRPYAYALAVGGRRGVEELIQNLLAEIDLDPRARRRDVGSRARPLVADAGVVLSGPGSVALEEIRVEPPGPGEVLVRIEATGVCHSDLHVIEENGWGHAVPGPARPRGSRHRRSGRRRRRDGRRPATASCSAGRRRAARARPVLARRAAPVQAPTGGARAAVPQRRCTS